MRIKYIIHLAILLLALQVNAEAIQIDPQGKIRPAEDLLYHGELMTSHQLIDLVRHGVDLSRLNPKASILWSDDKLESQVEQQEFIEADFNSYLASTKGLFRSSLDINNQATTLTVSLSNHGALLRHTLLRKLGYKLSPIKWVQKIKIHFATVEEKRAFLDNLSDRSLTARKRWVVENPADSNWVILRDVVLEEGRVRVHPIHWGVLSSASVKNRRIFRALLLPYVLGDFYENINLFAWSSGALLNGTIVLDYFMPEAFYQTSYADAQWIVRRMAQLSIDDWQEIAVAAALPNDVTALLLEKLKSRRNRLVELFKVHQKPLPVNFQVTIGNVKEGKLVSADYPNYALQLSSVDPDNPLRFSELVRYFSIGALNGVIHRMMDKINNYFQLLSSGDAIMQHREDIFNEYLEHLAKYGDSVPFELPLRNWGKPIAGGNLNFNRSVISSSYYGSSAPVQLVDSMTVRFNVGILGGIDGTGQAISSHLGGISLSRTYMHLTPVGSMKEALKKDWKEIVVAKFMHDLGKIITDDYTCTLPKLAWQERVVIDAREYVQINYDKLNSAAKEYALKIKEQLLSDGVSSELILLNPVERTLLCQNMVDELVDRDLKQFVDKMQVGEIFLVADGIGANLSLSAKIPLSALLGDIHGSVTLSAGGRYTLAKRVMIAKTEEGVQVYVQRQRTVGSEMGAESKYYISLLKVSGKKSYDRSKSKFFELPLQDLTGEEGRRTLHVLKALIQHNNSEILENDFSYYFLDHHVKNITTRFKLFLHHWDYLKQEHLLEITPPESDEYVNTDYKRTLFLSQKVKRYGLNRFSLLNDGIGVLTNGFHFDTRDTEQAGATFKGRAHWTTITTEDELTKEYASKPVAVFEEVWSGWSSKTKKFLKYVKKASKRFLRDGATVDLTQLHSTKKVMLYEIRGTFILYPQLLHELMKAFKGSKQQLFEYLVSLYGERRYIRECELQSDELVNGTNDIFHSLDMNFLPRNHNLYGSCLQSWVRSVMRLQKDARKVDDRKKQVKFITKALSKIFRFIAPAQFFTEKKKNQFFSIIKMRGFRVGNAGGNLDYLSDSVGEYDSELGAGIFKTISTQTHITNYEIYARYFAEGF